MDALIKKRSPVRATFTKLYKSVTTIFEDETVKSEQIESKFASLERIYLNLSELDNSIMELLLQDKINSDKYAEEFEIIEEYKEKFDDAKIRVRSFMQNLSFQQSSVCLNPEKPKLKLPKIELLKFGGEVKDWLSFWSLFSRIHEDKQMEFEDKFQYLIQCMIPGTRAKEIIDSYPPTAENYEKAIESLKSRFGREELLIEFYVRELLGLVVKNATNIKSKGNVIQLYDKLESYLRSLESIGMKSDKYAAMLFPLVESCIPEDLLRIWLRCPSISEADNSYSKRLDKLLLFLKSEVEGEERISLAKGGIKQNNSFSKKQSCRETEYPTANELLTSAKEISKPTCIFCDKFHSSHDCFQAQKMPLEKKFEILKNKKCCFSCLKIGHQAKNCKSKVRCMSCTRKHHIIMCPDFKSRPKVDSNEEKPEESFSLSSLCSPGEVLLQTVLVSIEGNGKTRVGRALIDTGSQCSYILKSTAEELGLKSEVSQNLTHVVFGGATSFKEHKCYRVKIKNIRTDYSCEISLLDQPIICGQIPRIQKGPWMTELKNHNIFISDVGKEKLPIELLIGADIAGKMYTGKVYQLGSGLTAVQTRLGWVLMGIQEENTSRNSMTSSLLAHGLNIEDLWKLEAIGIKDPCEQQSKIERENAVIDHFRKTVKCSEEGRYEIKLPWRENMEDLPDNRILAEKRLLKTTSKLMDEGRYQDYESVFLEWLKEGIIEEVPSHELCNSSCYLPHRGVFKSNSTTKVRPVFDASSKQKGFPSLNDCLEKGPNTLELIPAILTRFRENEIGAIADIKKAFLQISVNVDDRDYLRFIWWKNADNKEMKVFRHKRVVFGVNCSPFLLGAVISYHLEKATPENIDIAEKLKSSFYVDNCVASVNSENELKRFVEVSTQMLAEAKFELRGWEFSENKNSDVKEPSSVLGLLWDRVEDSLFCDTSSIIKPEEPLTRRRLLSVTQKIFDPVGFLCPVTLAPKLLLQESWKLKLTWDEEIPKRLAENFWKWFNELHLLSQVKIPRYMSLKNCNSTSLHIFCDASKKSYSAAVFLRSEGHGQIFVQLILAKSRITPLKEITIPRMELMACLIGARLADFVRTTLSLANISEYFWTDSSTALQWIKTDEPWTVFVRNRVKEIRRLSDVEKWRHVPGSLNPADLPSRGCSVMKLLSSRWWEGPSWLRLPNDSWPKSDFTINEETVLKERCIKSTSLVNNSYNTDNLFSRFSSYTKIVRILGWILRFYHNSQSEKGYRRKGNLTIFEITEAENKIIQMIQRETFTEESIKSLKTLNVFRDEEGIFRLKTKLTERDDSKDFRYPMLLPGKHRLVELLMREAHLKNSHAGVQILLSKLRENFWILNGRKSVRKEINKCLRCKRYNARNIETIPIGLPPDRVKEAAVFEVTGIDLAGPLFLKGGEKCWIVLFTCAVYRAVHLELVLSLSTKAFLLCLRRFIARRGRPKVIYSDNGKNFVGSENLLQKLNWSVIEQETSIQRIIWKFIPPSAPWWGGFWERIVQMIKKLLRRTLGNACLFYEEMVSILCDCESVINSRPLTYLSEDPDDLVPLTPSMFIQDIPTVGVPDLDELDKTNIKGRLKHQQSLRQLLRNRFRREYLGILVQPRKKSGYYEVKSGDIVLIEDDTKKRLFWPMAKVIEVYPSKDRNIRVVRLKTSKGEILRPVRRIYPLEISLSDEQEHIKKDNVGSSHDEPANFNGKTVTTRSGRIVKLPLRFLEN